MATEKELLLIEIREDGARVVKRNIADIGDTADKTIGVTQQLKTLLGGLVTARTIQNTIRLADTYANLLNRMRVVTGSAYELNRAMEGVFEITIDTRTALEGNVDMYARVALNTKRMGLAMQDVLRFSKQLNHAIILSGVTAREAQWGMVQFSQALAAGALRGDELRAVMEQLPVVTDVITRHMGITRGELRKLAFEGRVTSRVIIEAFNAAETELAERFAKRVPTLDQGLTVLRSSLIRFIGEQDQAWQSTSTLARILQWAANNMDILGRAAELAGIIIGGVLLSNTIRIISQWKILSLAIFKTHGMLMLFLAATAAIVVFADKIKIASNSTATLADVIASLGPELKTAAEAAREFWNSFADTTGLNQLKIESEITLEGILVTMGRVADNFAGILQGMVNVIINGVRVIGDHIGLILNKIGAFLSAIVQGFKQNIAALRSSIIAMAGAADAALSGNIDRAKKLSNVAAAALRAGAGKSVIDFYREQRSVIESEFKSTGKTSADAFVEGFLGAGSASEDMIKRVIGRAKLRAAARDAGQLTPPVDEGALTPQQQELRKSITGDMEKLAATMDDLFVLFQKGEITVDQYNRKLIELKQQSLETGTGIADGFKRGFFELGLEITNFADMAEKTITNAFNGMEDALVSFVTTGKVDFKSLVDSMLADLTRLLARQLIVKALGALGGAQGGVLGALFSATAPTAARAAGGPVSPGEAYRINEHRPGPVEVFVAGQQGRIVNNREAQAQGDGGERQIVVLNVWSEEDVLRIMDSNKGQQIIVNRSPGKNMTKR